jgi:hypothetical protein
MSSTFTVTRDQIIALALNKLGVLEVGDTPDSNLKEVCALQFNLLIKQLSTDGLKLWKVSELVVPITSGQTSYILGGSSSATMYDTQNPLVAITDKPLKVVQAWYRNTQVTPNIDTPMLVVSKQEYNILGSKFSTGSTNTVFYDVKALNGILYVYLTPDTNTATNTQIHLVAQMPLNDLTTATGIPDFPNEWMNCLMWSLADQMALDFGVPMNHRQEIAMKAKMFKDQMSDWDVEASSTFFQMDYRSLTPSSYSR